MTTIRTYRPTAQSSRSATWQGCVRRDANLGLVVVGRSGFTTRKEAPQGHQGRAAIQLSKPEGTP